MGIVVLWNQHCLRPFCAAASTTACAMGCTMMHSWLSCFLGGWRRRWPHNRLRGETWNGERLANRSVHNE
jgi:hypothetical protein